MLRRLHHAHDIRDLRFVARIHHTHGKRAVAVHGSRGNGVARGFRVGNGFAVDRGFINLGRAFPHHAVNRNAVAR